MDMSVISLEGRHRAGRAIRLEAAVSVCR